MDTNVQRHAVAMHNDMCNDMSTDMHIEVYDDVCNDMDEIRRGRAQPCGWWHA